MKAKVLISVVGPTAIGKTDLSIHLAKHFHTEVLSCDSRQFFKEMQIGTAVPEARELAEVKHHFIQNLSVKEPYSVGDFEQDALKKLEELFAGNDRVVMVGGSGLYVDAVVKGLDDFPELDPAIRKDLKTLLKNDGLAVLQEELRLLDPVSFSTIDLENPQRVIRALEVCLGTGKPFSSFLKQAKDERKFRTIKIGLTAPREIVYARINQRVELMMQAGLLDEVKKLYPHRDLNALQTVGYRELFAYLNGHCTLELAVEEIKKNTRRFAKRQFTWFNKDPEILWFDYKTPPKDVISKIETLLNADQ